MAVKQLSIFVENKTGSMVECTKLLAAEGIDLRALCIADTEDYGIVRVIVSDTYKAVNVLKDNGFVVNVADVVGCIMEDKPGACAEIIEDLNEENIAIRYMYAFAGKEEAYVILRVDDNKSCESILRSKGVKLLKELK